MTTDDGVTPAGHGQEWWRRALGHPDVAGVDVQRGLVRVRLHSGVELEWSHDDELPA